MTAGLRVGRNSVSEGKKGLVDGRSRKSGGGTGASTSGRKLKITQNIPSFATSKMGIRPAALLLGPQEKKPEQFEEESGVK